MYYLIWVTVDIPRLGIARDSRFELDAAHKGSRSLAEYVRWELGLNAGEWEVL